MAKDTDDGLMSPTEAIGEILHYAGSEFAAKQVLADGLRSGKLRIVADHVWETDVGDINEDWIPRRHGDRIYHENVELEPGFLSSSVQWPRDLAYWRWDKGEFVIIISPDDEWGRFSRVYIQGALLVRHEVMALVGRSSRSGGPKSDRERWAMFWINVLWDFTGEDFDWTQYGSPSELKIAFLSANEDAANEPGARGRKTMFADSNIDFAVELAWKHLVKRAAREAIREQLDLS